MIKEANQGLEDVLRHYDPMMRTQEGEEYIQRQEEAWRENEQLGSHKKNQNNERNNLKWTLI